MRMFFDWNLARSRLQKHTPELWDHKKTSALRADRPQGTLPQNINIWGIVRYVACGHLYREVQIPPGTDKENVIVLYGGKSSNGRQFYDFVHVLLWMQRDMLAFYCNSSRVISQLPTYHHSNHIILPTYTSTHAQFCSWLSTQYHQSAKERLQNTTTTISPNLHQHNCVLDCPFQCHHFISPSDIFSNRPLSFHSKRVLITNDKNKFRTHNDICTTLMTIFILVFVVPLHFSGCGTPVGVVVIINALVVVSTLVLIRYVAVTVWYPLAFLNCLDWPNWKHPNRYSPVQSIKENAHNFYHILRWAEMVGSILSLKSFLHISHHSILRNAWVILNNPTGLPDYLSTMFGFLICCKWETCMLGVLWTAIHLDAYFWGVRCLNG